jgi:guanylate kinase
MNNGKLIIFSAPSGAGKTTIVQYLLKEFPEQLGFSVSACNREKRNGEIDGIHYYFLSTEEFKQRISNNEFAEWEEVYKDHFYGTLKSEIERIWKLGKHVIFDIDVIGGINLKKQFGDKALGVFVMPPSIEHLELRLKSRETETPESIARRIAKADAELQTAKLFDKSILNDNLTEAFAEAKKVVSAFISQ